MKRLGKAALLLLLIAIGGISWRYIRQKDLTTRLVEIDAFLTAFHELDKFNGTVLVARDGDVLFQKGYGLRNAELAAPNDVDTVYRIYSVTKPFTSTLVLKLIEDGKLSFNDPLSKFYPAFSHGDEITVEHLLNHTSGLYDFTREIGFDNTEANLVKLLKNRKLEFAPGQRWQYCNSGYCLLGHIIAEVTGLSYEEAITQHIFTPLDMNDSGFGFEELDSPIKAVGYRPYSGNQWHPAGDATPRPFAAGAIYSSVGDLLLFHKAMQSHQIIGKASRDQAWAGCDQRNGYGLGWEISHRWIRRRVISHSGGAAGFRSNFSQMPGEGWCVIVLSNRESDNAQFVTDSIFDILDSRSVKVPVEKTVDVASFEPFVGYYQTEGKRRMSIRICIVGERLAAELAGQPVSTLLALGDSKFAQPEANAVVEFTADDQGEVNSLIFRQGVMAMNANRVAEKWGILGTATSVGWDGPDLPLVPINSQQGEWILKHIELSDGEVVFRVNNDWDFNFGDADDGILERNGPNIPVQAGTYDIFLNTSDGLQLNYEIRSASSAP